MKTNHHIHLDGTGGYYAEQNKAIRDRQLAHQFTHVSNRRNTTEDQKGRKGKLNGNSAEREKNHKRLLIRETN